MAWEVQEPTVIAPVEPTGEEQEPTADAAVPGTGEAASTGDEAASSPTTFDLSTEAGIAAAIEQSDLLRQRLAKQQNDGFQNGRQNRDAELRREQGSNERAQAHHKWLIDQLNEGADPEELAKQTPLYVKANEDFQRVALSRAFVTATLNHFGESAMPDELETALSALESQGDVAAIQGIASTAVQRVADKSKADTISTLKLADVPADAPLHAEIMALAHSLQQEEAAAQGIAAKQAAATNPPNVRGSAPGSVGMTTEQARALTPAQAANLSETEYEEWKRVFFVASANVA